MSCCVVRCGASNWIEFKKHLLCWNKTQIGGVENLGVSADIRRALRRTCYLCCCIKLKLIVLILSSYRNLSGTHPSCQSTISEAGASSHTNIASGHRRFASRETNNGRIRTESVCAGRTMPYSCSATGKNGRSARLDWHTQVRRLKDDSYRTAMERYRLSVIACYCFCDRARMFAASECTRAASIFTYHIHTSYIHTSYIDGYYINP